MKLKLPVFGNLFTKIAISRFARNLGTLLGVGVPVMQALDVVGATTGNAVISAAMTDVQDAVRQGEAMSGPLSQHTVFPPMVTQMVEVGEESGQISQMLDKIADFYDREVDQAAEQLTAAIEPIMVAAHGRHRRRHGRLPLPADVLDLPAHPGRERMTALLRVHRRALAPPQVSVQTRGKHDRDASLGVGPAPRPDRRPRESHRRLTMQDLLQRLRKMRSEKDERGFTLIELLVVVVIIGILIAIAIPLYLNYENGAKNKSSASDLRGAISTIEQCYTDNNNAYPTAHRCGTGRRYTFTVHRQQGHASSGSTMMYYTDATPATYQLVSYQGTAE